MVMFLIGRSPFAEANASVRIKSFNHITRFVEKGRQRLSIINRNFLAVHLPVLV
jgi:hypothetical protein